MMKQNEIITQFVKFLKVDRKLSENTVYNYKSDIEEFLKDIDKDIHDMTETDIISFISAKQIKGYKNATLNRKLSAIKTFFLFLLNLGYISSNPAFTVSIQRLERVTPDILEYDEVEKLLSMPDNNDDFGIRDKAILELIYGSGLKVGEITELNIGDVNLESEYIRCANEKNTERYIPITSHSSDALKNYLEYSRYILLGDNETDALFLNKFGKRISRQSVWKHLKDYGLKAGIDKEINSTMLRHSFAVHMMENGLSMDQIKEILGHKDISTTQIYRKKKDAKMSSAFKAAHNRK